MAENSVQNKRNEPEKLDLWLLLHDMIRGFRKYWYIGVILVLLLGVFGAYRAIAGYRPMYRCEATFTVSTQQAANNNYDYTFYYDKSTASQLVSTFPYILQSDLFTDRLLETLGRSSVGGNIRASSVADSNMFTLTVTSSSPETALEVLEAAIQVYPEVAMYVLGDIQLNRIDAARLPEAPYNQLEWAQSTGKFALLGLAAFLGLLLLYAMNRTTIRREEEMEKKLQLSSLGIIPQVVFKKRSQRVDRSLNIKNDKTGFAFQEGFRGMGLRTVSQLQEQNAQVLGVTSAAGGEGVSTVALNLARSMAEAGKKVIFMDGHFHQPTRKVRSGSMGLDAWLKDQCGLSDILSYHEKDKFYSLSIGKSLTDRELSQYRENLKKLIDQARKAADYILIDLPPCAKIGQAAPGLELCDAVMLVIRQDNLELSRIMDCVEDLSRFDAKLLGAVLNRAQGGFSGYGYHYGYSYSKYGYSRSGHYGRYGSYGGSGAYGYGYGYGYGKDSKNK